jgi:glycosyltransferase involved in cell wall biosynthesis
MSVIGVSFIVCSFNGAGRIPAVLKHLARQEVPEDIAFEVVLVDNASTDNTGQVAEDCWRSLGAPAQLTVVHEPQSGLSYARKAALKAARHEILAFVDDDNWIAADYCSRVARKMRDNPRLGAIGARGEAEFEGVVPPCWFTRFQAAYAVGPQMYYHPRRPLIRLYGAGLVLRKAALDTLAQRGFAPVLAGRTGTSLGAGDDTELCYALGLSGWKLEYDPDLMFKHVIPPKRLQKSYLLGLYRGFGQSSVSLDLYLRMASSRDVPPVRVAAIHCIGGLLTALLKVAYWSASSLLLHFQNEETRLNTQIQKVYFINRLRCFLVNWATELERARNLSIVLAELREPSTVRSRSADA